MLENTNSVTWLVQWPGKNILNIKQREGGRWPWAWLGPGPGLWSHTLVIIRGVTHYNVSRDTLSDITPALYNKNKEQKKDTDELIKLWRQLVQPNCPNKLGPFIVNCLNEFRRVIWLHLHKWVCAHSVHVTRWSPITPRSCVSIERNYTVFHLPGARSIMWDWQKTEHLLLIGNHVTKK